MIRLLASFAIGASVVCLWICGTFMMSFDQRMHDIHRLVHEEMNEFDTIADRSWTAVQAVKRSLSEMDATDSVRQKRQDDAGPAAFDELATKSGKCRKLTSFIYFFRRMQGKRQLPSRS